MGILSWIIVGGFGGWIGSKIMNTDKSMGLLANILLGILGGFVGGLVIGIFGGSGVTGLNIWSILVAALGSVLTIWIVKKIK